MPADPSAPAATPRAAPTTLGRRPARGHHAAAGRGILCMVAGSGLLTCNDAIIKWLTESLPIGQIMTLRGLILCALLLALLAARADLEALRMHDPRRQALRALLMIAATFLFLRALNLLPLADATAITFASPLFATALAVPLLREQVGWRRWTAVLVGFGGVLLLARPNGSGASLAAGLALAVAFLVAFMDITTRRLNLTETSVGILFYTSAAVALAGLFTLPGGWAAVDWWHWGLLAASALLMGLAQYLQIEAFRYAGASTVAPYRYASLLWAVLFGFLIWGHLPDLLGAAGMLLVIGSGLWIWHRETRRAAP